MSNEWDRSILIDLSNGKDLWYDCSSRYVADDKSVWSWRKIGERSAEFL